MDNEPVVVVGVARLPSGAPSNVVVLELRASGKQSVCPGVSIVPCFPLLQRLLAAFLVGRPLGEVDSACDDLASRYRGPFQRAIIAAIQNAVANWSGHSPH